jgi:elongation factor 1-alpha
MIKAQAVFATPRIKEVLKESPHFPPRGNRPKRNIAGVTTGRYQTHPPRTILGHLKKEEYSRNEVGGNCCVCICFLAHQKLWFVFSSEMDVNKIHITMILIGHIDSGKSALLGHFLTLRYQFLDIHTRQRLDHHPDHYISTYDTSHHYIRMVDRLRAEQQQGLTIDTSLWKFVTPKYDYTAINSPGHRDFIRNMMTGTAQADIALLVIDCSPGGFECGWSPEGQTREHILIALTLGIRQVVVGLNKMDACNYSEIRFNEIKDEVAHHLKTVGFQESGIVFVPISAREGDNLVERSAHIPWYRGLTLLEALDAVQPPARRQDKPLRLPIQRHYVIGGVGVVGVGRVASGVLRSGMAIRFSPSGVTTEVGSIQVHHETVNQASQGQIVGFQTTELWPRGEVGSDPFDSPALVCETFQAQVIVIDHPGVIKCGYCPIMSCHTAYVPVRLKSIDANLGSSSLRGSVLDHMVEGKSYLATFEPLKPMVVECFSEYPALGRFLLRDLRRTVAVGIVKNVQNKYQKLGKGAR